MRRKSNLTLYDCDRCMFTYKKKDLRRQRGMLLCDPCFDSVLEIEPVNLKLRSPRSNSNTVTAENNPTVFTIGTAGVTYLSSSYLRTRMGVTNSFVMDVVGLPTNITATSQIVGATQGTLLTLVGTDDVNYVIINVGNGTDLTIPMILKNGTSISLVYNASSGTWWETSRYPEIGGYVSVDADIISLTFKGDPLTFNGDPLNFTGDSGDGGVVF